MDDAFPRAPAADEFFLLPDHRGIRFGRVLAALHRHIQPRSYLEIGTLAGGTLRLADCAAIAVDPVFAIDQNAMGDKPACLLMQMPSDTFFAKYDPTALLNRPIDLAFLDGMHLFEFLLRDFINTERHCTRESIILMHDCVPTDAYVARRELGDSRFAQLSPHPEWWAGDVWKTLVILKQCRPDLKLLAFDAEPTGLAVVTNLDPSSAVLSQRYFALAEQFRSARLSQAGAEAFMRWLDVQSADRLEDPGRLAGLFGSRSVPAPAPPRRPVSRSEPAPTTAPKPANGPIGVHAFDAAGGPAPGLEDLWPRLHPLLLHWQAFNADEAKLRAQQHAMVRDGCFLMPSPFGDRPDLCTSSYYVAHRFCYRFGSVEEYFWISEAPDGAFALSAMFFPERRVAICLEQSDTLAGALTELERVRAVVRKPAAPDDPRAGRRIVVTGHSHYMHTLWNELPALDHAARSGLDDCLTIVAAYQPLGPIAELFPEFAEGLRRTQFDEVAALNGAERLLVGLGARTITPRVQERLCAVAARHAGAAVLAARDRFRAAHSPIFWLSVKAPGRTCLRQAEALAHLIAAAKATWPSAGFIVNGTSRPWDLERNDNYGSWFSDGLTPLSAYARQAVADVLARLPAKLRSCVQAVSDVPVCDEIVWGGAADFYFCHGGTMQHKIGWIHRIPGMVHSSNEFMDAWKSLAGVVEDAPPCWFVSPDIIVDREPQAHPAFTRERTAANYDFTSLDALAAEFLSAARECLPRTEAPPPQQPRRRRRKQPTGAV